MKYLELLRAQRAELEARRSDAIDAMDAAASAAIDEKRSLTPDEDSSLEQHRSAVAAIDAEMAPLDARIGELEQQAARSAEIAKRPSLQVISKPDAAEVATARDATPQQLADAVTRSLEPRVDRPHDMDHVRKLVLRHRADRDWVRSLIARSSDVYESAWSKVICGRSFDLTVEERTALSTVTNANGNFLVPTHLDPTVILSNSGSQNIVRSLSRVVTLTRPGDTSWQGITSDGVTASFDAQLAEVSDDSPTFAQPTIAVHKAQALVQASLEAAEDIPGLAGEILMMFADARDRLEGSVHCTGTGSDQPYGIFTALDANAAAEIVSDTAAAINKEDLDEVYRSVPARYRSRATWLMHPIWAQAIQNLGSAVSNKYTTDMAAGTTGTLYGRPVVESDDAPSTTTTTVKDNEIIFGDFSNYVIVDKPGSFAVEFIPHLFNTSNNLPDGRRAWYATWRTGADSVVDTAFRLLQDKTSA